MRSSLFVGRWQPFHEGHKRLVESVLKKKKPIVVAIRGTEISEENPYTVSERWTMIQKALREYGELVKIVVIPDIDEICYGRDVGYKIRRIELDHKSEKISGSTVRKEGIYSIYWLTGQTGAGKTTLANALQKRIGGVVLDGDEMRESISLGSGFSKKDRMNHNLRVARLAKVLSKRGNVIVSVIAPYNELRVEINEMISPIWIYVKKNLPIVKNKPYEIPAHPHIIVDSDEQSTQDQVKIILKYINK
jgi:adenylylsulfate kinase-like enzyme